MVGLTQILAKMTGLKEQSDESWTEVVKVALTHDQWYRIKEIILKNLTS